MKSLKRLLAVVLSIAMVLGTMTVTAMAADPTSISDLNGLTTALSTGGDYILDSDIVFTERLTAAMDITTTIDLNGHKIYRTSGGGVMLVSGTLTVKDTSASADGYIGFEKPTNSSKVSTLFEVELGATFNLQSGGLKNMKSTHDSAQVIKNAGTFNMTGGFITSIQSTNRRGLQNNSSTAVMNLSGGEIYGNTNGTGADVFLYNGTVNISGDMKINGKLDAAKGKAFNITGGWFSTQPTSTWIAEGYKWQADTTTYDGYAGHVIEGKTPKVAEVTIGGTTTQYESFDAAVTAAIATTTTADIKLLEDCAKTTQVSTIAADTTVTLDLNGKTLTNTYTNSDATSYKHRYFTVAGTFTIKDTSTEQTGTIYANDNYTGKSGAITYANPGKVYITGGNYYEGAAQGESTNNCFANTSTGTHSISGGWFAENARPTNNASYIAENYKLFSVDDESKAATPYTVSNTTKTINYLKNGGSGTDVAADTYAYKTGYTRLFNVKSLSYTMAGYTCVGWSTDKNADPDGTDIIGSGEAVNFADETKYPGDTIDLYAIYKQVDPSMWVCVDTADNTIGYADLASAFVGSNDVTLIKNYEGRTTIEVSGDRRLNLNGYNITANTSENPTGSAIVVKTSGGTLSIYNEDAETITVAGTDYTFGNDGTVTGYAQGTGGAIDVIGSVGAVLKIYGGTFTGDAPNHGTVITNSGVGKTYIYGGTFIPANSESTVDTLYANTGKIFIMADTQSDVKIQGVIAKKDSTATVGIVGGYFSDLQPNATIGTYDSVNDRMTADPTKSLIANTGDETYPYSVSATPWYITYNLDGGENDPANPAIVDKTDATAITLQPASKDGYTFTGWTDEDGNAVTAIKGEDLTADLTLTANYEIINYTITYYNMKVDATTPTITTFTVNDNVVLEKPTRPAWYLSKWTEGAESGGDTITGWNAGEKLENVDVWANWSSAAASVQVGEGTVVGYKNLADAVAATLEAGTDSVTLKVLKEQTIDSRIELRTDSSDYTARNITIDLNEQTITKESAISGFFIINKNSTVTLKGGTLDCATYGGAYFYVNKDATLNVTDGTFAGGETIKTGNGNVVITGGTWNIDPTEYVDTTKYIVQTDTPSTGLYTVIIDPSLGDIFKVGETGYKTVAGLNAAIADGTIADGSTIKCLGEIETTSPEAAIKVAKKIELTIDLDGNDVVAPQTDKFLQISNGAEVNITGGGSIASSHTETAGGTLINVGANSTLNVDADATITACGTAGTETLPIYSKGFVYIAESMVPTVDGKVYQAQTAAKITSASIELNSDLTMTLETMVAPAATDIYGTLELVSTTLPSGVSTTTAMITGAGAHTLKVEHINASQMANKFTVTPTVNGTAVGSDFEYSIVDYALDLYDRFGDEPVENAALLTLVANLLAYGKEAQAYWPAGGGVAFNVPTEYTSFVTTTAPTATDNVKATTVSASDASNYKIQSATLNVNEKVSIVVTVFATGNFTATCDGQAVTQDDAMLLGTNTYRVIFEALNPSQFNDTYTVSLANAGGTEVHAVQYSVNSYCYNMKSNAQVGALALAIYNYGVAAEAYIVEN